LAEGNENLSSCLKIIKGVIAARNEAISTPANQIIRDCSIVERLQA